MCVLFSTFWNFPVDAELVAFDGQFKKVSRNQPMIEGFISAVFHSSQ